VFQDVWLNMILWTSMADMFFNVSPHCLIASHRLGQAGYRKSARRSRSIRPSFRLARNHVHSSCRAKCTRRLPAELISAADSLIRIQSFPSTSTSVTFYPFFKVLFIFRSHYLFAIGFSPLFSLRCHLPPHWNCIPKQSYSLMIRIRRRREHPARYGTVTLSGVAFQRTLTASLRRIQTIFETTIQLVSWFQSLSYISYSLAATRDISVDFFSSAD